MVWSFLKPKSLTSISVDIPLSYLTFKDVKEPNFESTLNKIYSLIDDEFGRHEKKIESIIENLTKIEQKKYFDIIEGRFKKR